MIIFNPFLELYFIQRSSLKIDRNW